LGNKKNVNIVGRLSDFLSENLAKEENSEVKVE
jgi:hypothetical protein